MISESGFWKIPLGNKFDQEHVFDPHVAREIYKLASKLKCTKMYDFGCGNAKYVQYMNSNGINSKGFDGNPTTSNFPNCFVQDLTLDSFQLDENVDLLMCLEVCEHVPKKLEDSLLKNIDKHLNHGGTLVLSWAVKGQSGLGHVNCQNNDYVLSKFIKMGYVYDLETSTIMRKSAVKAHWFKNTIMVFKKI